MQNMLVERDSVYPVFSSDLGSLGATSADQTKHDHHRAKSFAKVGRAHCINVMCKRFELLGGRSRLLLHRTILFGIDVAA